MAIRCCWRILNCLGHDIQSSLVLAAFDAARKHGSILARNHTELHTPFGGSALASIARASSVHSSPYPIRDNWMQLYASATTGLSLDIAHLMCSSRVVLMRPPMCIMHAIAVSRNLLLLWPLICTHTASRPHQSFGFIVCGTLNLNFGQMNLTQCMHALCTP